MTTGLLDYFTRRIPRVAAEQLRLARVLSLRLGLEHEGTLRAARPNPFLFSLAHQDPLPPRERWDQWLVERTSGPLEDRRLGRDLAVPRSIPSAFRPLFGPASAARSAPPSSLNQLEAAWRLTGQVGARHWIRQVVRLVVLFRGGALNSFYNPRAHGAVFLRLDRHGDRYHLLEELIHQAGHAFFAILWQLEPPLVRGQKAEVSVTFDAAGDDRNLLVAFHGLVTETLIAEALSRLRSKSARAEQDTLGRLAFCLAKLGSDLNTATRHKRFFTPRGLLWLSMMARSYATIVGQLGAHLSRVDLSDQPYVFDSRTFERNNRWMAARSATTPSL